MAKAKQEFDLVPLILKVKENPILYNTNQEDYGDPVKTNRAWNGIARELLLPNGEVVRSKWKSTCEIYLKSLKGNKKNAALKGPWTEHMKYFEPYLTNGKTSNQHNKDDTTVTSTPSKKSVPQKRQRSPVEVATSHKVSRSRASVEEELGGTNSPMKKSRMSMMEETVESKVTKTTPRKSETLKASSRRLPRSSLRAQEYQVSINEEEEEEESSSSTSSEKATTKSSNKTINVPVSTALPIGISPEMKKGPRRLPRSVLRALEAEAENQSSMTAHSQQAGSSPSISRTHSAKASTSVLNQTIEASPSVSISSRSTKQTQRFSLDPNLSSVHSPLRSTRYSSIPEELSSREDPVSSARFSTSRTVTTGATPVGFRESRGYFGFTDKEPRQNDIEMTSENPSIFSSPARNSVSSVTASSRRLPRSSALEEEFARHDAMMKVLEDDINERNCSKRVSVAPGTKEDMDATDLLFLSHALTVKSFSERKQLEVKRKIAQIIAQAEIDEMA